MTLTAPLGRGQQPELVIQTGHADDIFAISFSPDGATLASGDIGGAVKLWDVATGAELRTLRSDPRAATSVAFSPDGRTLAVCVGGAVRLWVAATGKQIPFDASCGHTSSLAFTPDGKILAAGNDNGKIRLWEIPSGRELRTLEGHAAGIAVSLSPDGHTLAANRDDGIDLWDIPSGTLKRVIGEDTPGVDEVLFSPDGKRIAALAHTNAGGLTKVWDASTGAELYTLPGVHSLAFSPDGKILAGRDDPAIKLWDASTGMELRAFGYAAGNAPIKFSPDGKTLACGGAGRQISLWDVATGGRLQDLQGHTSPLFALALSPDGRTMASGGPGKKVFVWDAATRRELRAFAGHEGGVFSLAFSPDGKTLASGSEDGTARLWDISTGAILQKLEVQPGGGVGAPLYDTNDVHCVAFNPDGKTMAVGVVDGTVQLWDVSTGTRLFQLRGQSPEATALAFSPDGTILATVNAERNVALWDAATGNALRQIEGTGAAITSLAFSPDGKVLASGNWGGAILLYHVSHGTMMQSLKGDSAKAGFSHPGLSLPSVAFSPDGGKLAVSNEDYSISVWDLAMEAETRRLVGHQHAVSRLAFMPNGGVILSSSFDGSLKLWDAAGGGEVATVIALEEGEWAVATPDGLFDGTPGAWRLMLWRFNQNTYEHAPVEAFFNEYFYPDLLTDILNGVHPQAPPSILSKDIRPPQVSLGQAVSVPPGKEVEATNINVKVEVSEARPDPGHTKGGGVRDIRLFRNGSLVKLWAGDAFRLGAGDGCEQKGAGKVVCSAQVPLVAGENRVTAYAFNSDNVKSRDAELPQPIVGADILKRGSTMYVLAVGVNEYKDESKRLNLRLAVKDAVDFGEQVRTKQEAVGGYERRVVVTLRDTEATKANVMHALRRLATRGKLPLPEGAPKELEQFQHANANDAVVVYFAGHGVAAADRFYLLTHDFGEGGRRGVEELRSHGISDEELEAAFEPVVADKLMMVIDACNSGQALGGQRAGRGPMNSKGLAQLAYDKGMYILTAAQSQQAALEVERLGHGLLTYALVEEGLVQAKAEKNNDGQIVGREWLDYATERVPQLQVEEMAARSVEVKTGRKTRDILVKEDDDPTLPADRRAVQRPRVFYRRELEAQPLVVARPRAQADEAPRK